jgi:hypothetical protein
MQKILLVVIIFFTGYFVNAQPITTVVKEVASGLQTGSANIISKYFGAAVNFGNTTTTQSYSKAQCQMLLVDFFTQHQPISFTVLQNTSTENFYFLMGQLYTNNGIYRVVVYFKKTAKAILIQDITLAAQ